MQGARTPIETPDVFALMAKAMAMQPLGHDAMELRARPSDPPAAESEEPRRGLLERLDDWLWKHEQREREAYLAASTDIYDLEARIRDLERGVPYRCY
jgi:hypothetical protein